MFTIDVTKNQLSKAINDHQRNLNNSNTHRIKQHRSDFIMQKPSKARIRNSTEHKVYIHKNLADVQKEQIELRKIDAANDLIKSRIQDEQNLLKNQQAFPYGKENVGISEDVLQRYKGNYIQQSRVLQKFRMQAELMKKTSRVKGSQGKPFQWCYRQNVVDNKKKQQQLKRMRQTLQQRLQEQRAMRQKQKQSIRKIAQTLGNLSVQLDNNSYTLEKGIRQLQDRLKKNQRKLLDFPRPKHTYKDILDLQTSSSKIPIVVYNNEPFDARLYFSDIFKKTQKVEKQKKSNVHQQQYRQIVRILNENNRRLHYLDNLSKNEREI